MSFTGKSVVITGAGRGIGRAIAQDFASAGANVFVSDKDTALTEKVSSECGGQGFAADISTETGVCSLIDAARAAVGDIDIYISNAGFAVGEPNHAASAPDAVWQSSWDVHVMAHVRACRVLLPDMIACGSGHLVQIASAAGLLSQVGDAAYSATKHAAVSFSQSLAITHGDDGIDVSVVCPLYVATPLLGYDDDSPKGRPNDRVLTAEQVSKAVLSGMEQGRFLILPHPEAADFARARMNDMDTWISKMQHVRRKALQNVGDDGWQALHRYI